MNDEIEDIKEAQDVSYWEKILMDSALGKDVSPEELEAAKRYFQEEHDWVIE